MSNIYGIGKGYNSNVRYDESRRLVFTLSVPDAKYGQLHGVVVVDKTKTTEDFANRLRDLLLGFEFRRLNIPVIGCRARLKGSDGPGQLVIAINRVEQDPQAWVVTLEDSVTWPWSHFEYAP